MNIPFQYTKRGAFLCAGLFCCCVSAVFAQDSNEDFTAVYGDRELVSIATGSKQPLALAPAVATVITEEEIRATGAAELDDVLETVPGLYVGRYQNGYMPQYVFRGIFSDVNPQVLLLINGVPLTTLYTGNRGIAWGGMPVREISRIEIIRGPGSAVYGADAFAGVINVITKDYATTKNEVGARVGSFNTQEAWWLQRGAWKDLKLAFGLELLKTKGQRETVQSDFQSFWDAKFGTSVSEAPGPVNTGKKSLETHLSASYKGMQLKLGYQGRFKVGMGGGIASALDPRGHETGKRFVADLTYNHVSDHSPWDITAQLTYLNLYDAANFFLFPPNAMVTFGGPPALFPEGVHGAPENYERGVRGSLSAFYTGFANHRIRVGAGANRASFYKVKERKNFDGTLAPLPGGFMDVSHDPTLVFMLPRSRVDRFAFLQDEWALAQNWDLTLGVREDIYSDFGRTVNPRTALVWKTSSTLITKLLYGRAFRSPSFAEQYLINNPVAVGKSGLAPETIETLELAESFRPTERLKLSVNGFAYRMKKILRFVATGGKQEAKNTGRQWGQGIEAEFEWDITDRLKWVGNYAFQRSTDRSTRKDAGNAPHHHGYVRGEWTFLPKWMGALQSNLTGKRFRVAGDTRPDVSGFATVDMNIRYGTRETPWSAGVVVQNIFDRIGRVPTIAPGLIPGDLPLPGRAAFVDVEFRL